MDPDSGWIHKNTGYSAGSGFGAHLFLCLQAYIDSHTDFCLSAIAIVVCVVCLSVYWLVVCLSGRVHKLAPGKPIKPDPVQHVRSGL